MINKAFDDISARDIEGLIDNRVQERRTLDYKESLPGNSDADKREFLGDVASFATASGGLIIFGVSDQRDDDGLPTGIPDAIHGLGGANTDAEILRLESICRESIDPRVHGIQMKSIANMKSGAVVLVRVPKSLFGPHRVTYKGSSRFYSRNSAGKYPLDTMELRAAFAAAEELPERLRRWRAERLAKIVADETPTLLSGVTRVVLHVTHARAFDPTMGVEFISVGPADLPPMSARGWNHRINFDGLLTYSPGPDGKARSYLQLFRNGAVEAVDSTMLGRYTGDDGGTIPTQAYEKEIIDSLAQYLRKLHDLGVEPPIYVMLTLLGVKGYRLGTRNAFRSDLLPIDRDLLVMPEIVIDEDGRQADELLRQAFDAVWQAGGFHASPYYDQNGRWVGRS